MSFLPKGVERIKPAAFCMTYLPVESAVVKPDSSFITFIPSPQECTASSDTERNVAVTSKTSTTAHREVLKTEIAKAATARFVQDLSAPVNIEAPAVREIFVMNHVTAETHRELYGVQVASAGAVIQTSGQTEASISFYRTVCRTVMFSAETARRIPYFLKETESNPLLSYKQAGIQSLSITLSERTLSDSFQMMTVKPLSIEEEVKGKLLDYSYRFLVEETSQKDLVQSVKGMYGIDEMLYTTFVVYPRGTMCSTYLQQIADALGLKVSAVFEDYEMAQDYAETKMTYHDFISALFGWTSRLPQRQINVFIRGDTLHVLQRGMEKSVLDISNWPHTRPLINRKLIRSLWNYQMDEDDEINSRANSDANEGQIPFSGVIGIGKVSLEYTDGFLMFEENNGTETEYSYDGEYLKSKVSRQKDGTVIKTEYKYFRTLKDIYLMEETEITDTTNVKDKTESNGEEISTRSTYHAPIGGGWYLTSVYQNGKFEGSSLSQGPPGGKASQYMVDAMNRHLSRDLPGSEENLFLCGDSLIDTSFPVKGDVFLRKLTKAIEWLNRKTQEEVSVEIVVPVKKCIPGITHVVDFTERIKLDGHEYYLVSNNIELTPRSLRQKLKLVRWI